MNDLSGKPRDLVKQIQIRLRQRYLRWRARQPARSTCESQDWRAFRRRQRRRLNACRGSRTANVLMYCIAACGAVFILGLAATIMLGGMFIVPAVFHGVFFSEPQHHPFANPAESAAVAFLRLTWFQTLALPLLILLTVRNRSATDRCHRRFYRGRDLVRTTPWQLILTGIVISSIAVALAATWPQPDAVAAGMAAAVGYSCFGWLIFGVAKWLMAVRLPGALTEPAVRTAVLVVPGFLLVPAGIGILYGKPVLKSAEYVDWFGPLGWINGSLYRFSLGEFDRFWLFAVLSVAAAAIGQVLNRHTSTWKFRRRLLTAVRTEELPRRTKPRTGSSRGTIAVDLRRNLAANSRGSWCSWGGRLLPYWWRDNLTYLGLLWGSLLVVQILFGALSMFLTYVEQSSVIVAGDAIREQQVVDSLAAFVAGWSVVFFELLAIGLRDGAKLAGFARRPVSPSDLWWDLQRNGLKALPLQILYAIPLLAIPAWLSPDLLRLSVVGMVIALVSCIGIRTVISAAMGYVAALMTLRELVAAPLLIAGALASMLLLAASFDPLVSFGPLDGIIKKALLHQLYFIPATLGLFVIAWSTWHALSRPHRLLRRCW